MKTSILKKATLVNKGLWTTTITWTTILKTEDDDPAEIGKTCIIVEEKIYRNKEHSYTKVEKFKHEEFDKAHNRFHELIKEWS